MTWPSFDGTRLFGSVQIVGSRRVMQLLPHDSKDVLMVVLSTGRACASCLRTWPVPRRCRGPARRLSLWETEHCGSGSGCAWACLCWCWLGCAGVLCGVEWCVMCCPCGNVGSARAVARGYLGWHGPGWRSLRLRGIWHVVAGRRGGVGRESGWERGALRDPIVCNDSCKRRGIIM